MAGRTLPGRRFTNGLTTARARLGADVDCYPFVVMDLYLNVAAATEAGKFRCRETARGLIAPRAARSSAMLLSALSFFAAAAYH